MYNRYKSQSDGTFVKKTLPENTSPLDNSQRIHRGNTSQESQQLFTPPVPTHHGGQRPTQHTKKALPKDDSASTFLKNLLPKNMEVSDILIIILLLLISNDCPEEHNNALLTLALYLLI